MYIEGSLKTRKWQDKDGQDRYTTEIVADEMKMLGSRQGGGDAASRGSDRASERQGGGGGNGVPASQPGYAGDFEDDIPFASAHMASDPAFMKATAPIRRMA